jgi:hypothetical protein
MIHEVDAAITEFIRRDTLGGATDIDVVFEAPTTEWSSRRNAPTINCFLYDIREDLTRRDTAGRPIYNEEGIIVDRQPPSRRFKLSYIMTAWTQRPEDEHRILSELLRSFIQFDHIPEQYLQGWIAEQPLPVMMAIALPPTQDRSLSDIWSALGGEMKPSIDLRIVAPLETRRSFETGPPAMEAPRIMVRRDDDAEAAYEARRSAAERVHDERGTAVAAIRRSAANADAAGTGGGRRRGKGDTAADEGATSSREPLVVVDPDEPTTEVLRAGTPQFPGRTVRIRPLPHRRG